MVFRLGGALVALLLASSACAHSSSPSDAASQSSATSPSSGALDGVKYRVPVYSSNLTSAATPGMEPGIYQFQTSDSALTVMAWYKSHIPNDMGGSWVSSDPSGPADITDWSYVHPHLATGEFSVDISRARKGVPVYATATKTLVEVVDR